MFTSKKDQEIEVLQAQIKSLNEKIQSVEKSWLNCREEHEKTETKLLTTQKELREQQEYYSSENARLRRMIASEKQRRKNSQCANRRKLFGRKKTNFEA